MNFPEEKEKPGKSLQKEEPVTAGNFPPYTQVFSQKHGFIPDLSIIDLLFNLGPESSEYLA
jgi:hypothetical protein